MNKHLDKYKQNNSKKDSNVELITELLKLSKFFKIFLQNN